MNSKRPSRRSLVSNGKKSRYAPLSLFNNTVSSPPTSIVQKPKGSSSFTASNGPHSESNISTCTQNSTKVPDVEAVINLNSTEDVDDTVNSFDCGVVGKRAHNSTKLTDAEQSYCRRIERSKQIQKSLASFSSRTPSAEVKMLEDSIIDSDDDNAEANPFDLASEIIESQSTQSRYSEPIISSGTLTQCSTQNTADVFIDTQSSGNSIEIPQPSAKIRSKYASRRMKCIQGGLVEQLRKTISRNKSNLSFWLNERQSKLIKCGDTVRIDSIEHQYGRTLLHCICPNGDKKIVFLSSDFKKINLLHAGMSVEIEFDGSTGYRLGDAIAYPNVYKILL